MIFRQPSPVFTLRRIRANRRGEEQETSGSWTKYYCIYKVILKKKIHYTMKGVLMGHGCTLISIESMYYTAKI